MAGEVTVESDYYDITMEVGYRYGEGVNDVLVNNESVVQAGKARITVPTKVSDLENDNNYQSANEVARAVAAMQSQISIEGETLIF